MNSPAAVQTNPRLRESINSLFRPYGIVDALSPALSCHAPPPAASALRSAKSGHPGCTKKSSPTVSNIVYRMLQLCRADHRHVSIPSPPGPLQHELFCYYKPSHHPIHPAQHRPRISRFLLQTRMHKLSCAQAHASAQGSKATAPSRQPQRGWGGEVGASAPLRADGQLIVVPCALQLRRLCAHGRHWTRNA